MKLKIGQLYNVQYLYVLLFNCLSGNLFNMLLFKSKSFSFKVFNIPFVELTIWVKVFWSIDVLVS